MLYIGAIYGDSGIGGVDARRSGSLRRVSKCDWGGKNST